MSAKVQFIFVKHTIKFLWRKLSLAWSNNERPWCFKSCICRCRASNGVSAVLNPLYEYFIYFGIGALALIFILIQLTKSFLPKNNIRISRGLSGNSDKESHKDNQSTDEINEIRAPTQNEFNLEDPNEIKFLSFIFGLKKRFHIEVESFANKIGAYGLEFTEGSFIKRGSEKLINILYSMEKRMKDLDQVHFQKMRILILLVLYCLKMDKKTF